MQLAKFQLINDHFQNYKPYAIPKAQLVIADIPYNIGKNAEIIKMNGRLLAVLSAASQFLVWREEG